ncbi:MAG TPA: dihydroorotate dehydrogenase [Actinomycetota bacterium]
MVTPDLSVDLAGIKLRTPVMSASGCFASGKEASEFFDLRTMGAVVVKSMTVKPWSGKPSPRMAETPSGMLNAIGLQNKGVDHFLAVDLPWLRRMRVPVIASIAGNTLAEYQLVAQRLRGAQGVVGVEVNISCPNLEDRNNMFAHDAKATAGVIAGVRRALEIPVFAKLSPNVTSITEIARAALDGGANGLSLVNTLVGMAIDVETRRPKLSGVIGGLSGPAIKPVAVRAVYDVAQAFPSVPIIGMGGIMDEIDALEFVLAGATAVALGTVVFVNPRAPAEIVEGLERYLLEHGIRSIAQLRGQVKVDAPPPAPTAPKSPAGAKSEKSELRPARLEFTGPRKL